MLNKEILQELDEKYEIAKNLYENGILKNAKELFKELILKDPFIWQFWFAIGAIYQKEKNYFQAIFSYNLAKLLNKENAFLYFHAAESFLSINNKKKASDELKVAKKLTHDANLLDKIEILEKQNNL